ncbi:exported hypothetical protein [Frankia canadensis]|uniref:Uncharacterized protein n=1 Tax=Frankia canadensis TaxID=1836972 RepID=A0A2I2KJX3_9ACTN|nr:exported hypothetical protein [Frankia canadensis]SOU53237.1 exported hypothetical protein [Frankia canadensis]
MRSQVMVMVATSMSTMFDRSRSSRSDVVTARNWMWSSTSAGPKMAAATARAMPTSNPSSRSVRQFIRPAGGASVTMPTRRYPRSRAITPIRLPGGMRPGVGMGHSGGSLARTGRPSARQVPSGRAAAPGSDEAGVGSAGAGERGSGPASIGRGLRAVLQPAMTRAPQQASTIAARARAAMP